MTPARIHSAIVASPLSVADAHAFVADPASGATVVFTGQVRDHAVPDETPDADARAVAASSCARSSSSSLTLGAAGSSAAGGALSGICGVCASARGSRLGSMRPSAFSPAFLSNGSLMFWVLGCG